MVKLFFFLSNLNNAQRRGIFVSIYVPFRVTLRIVRPGFFSKEISVLLTVHYQCKQDSINEKVLPFMLI